MNRYLQRVALCALLGGVLFSGCATGSRAVKKSGTPADKPLAKKPARGDDEGGEAALERRVRAIAHFAAGISAELNEEDTVALEHYLDSAAADPGHEVLILELARRFLQNREAGKAVELLIKATASAQASGKIFAWLGRAYAEVGKPELAVKADLAAISRNPELLMGYRNLFAVYQENRQLGEALKVLDNAAGQSPDDPEFWVELAELYSSYNQLHPDESANVKPKVVAALDRAAGLKPKNLLLIQKLADGYKLMGEFSRAEQFFLELLDRFPALPGTREKLADIYLRTGRKEKATEQLEAISRDNPRNEQAYYYLGNLASQEKRWSDAAEYFEQALTLKPEFEPVYYRLAELKINMNKPRDALELLDKARARFKQNFVLEFLAGEAHARAKQFGEAVRHFTQAEVIAKASEPDSLTHLFYFHSGAAFERNGDYAGAEKYFRKCLELSPEFAEALNYLGYMWAERGEKLDEAEKLIGKAVKLEPENAAFLDSMGWVLFKRRQPREALDWLQKAVQHSQEPDPTLYDHLGDIYCGLKEFDKAREAWRKSIELEPSDQVKRKLDTTPAGTGPAK